MMIKGSEGNLGRWWIWLWLDHGDGFTGVDLFPNSSSCVVSIKHVRLFTCQSDLNQVGVKKDRSATEMYSFYESLQNKEWGIKGRFWEEKWRLSGNTPREQLTFDLNLRRPICQAVARTTQRNREQCVQRPGGKISYQKMTRLTQGSGGANVMERGPEMLRTLSGLLSVRRRERERKGPGGRGGRETEKQVSGLFYCSSMTCFAL